MVNWSPEPLFFTNPHHNHQLGSDSLDTLFFSMIYSFQKHISFLNGYHCISIKCRLDFSDFFGLFIESIAVQRYHQNGVDISIEQKMLPWNSVCRPRSAINELFPWNESDFSFTHEAKVGELQTPTSELLIFFVRFELAEKYCK